MEQKRWEWECVGGKQFFLGVKTAFKFNFQNRVINCASKPIQFQLPQLSSMTHNTPPKIQRFPKSPHHDLDLIFSLNNESLFNAIQDQNYQPSHLTHQLHQKINSLAQTHNRKYYFRCLAVYYNNIALLNQKLPSFNCRKQYSKEASSAMEKSLKNYEYLKGFLQSREETIVHGIQLAEAYLKYCALMSQIGYHDISIIYAEKGLEKIIQCGRLLEAVCNEELIQVNKQIKQKKSDYFDKIESVCFKGKVLRNAKQILKEISSLPLSHKLLSKDRSYFQKIMDHIYFWENQKQSEKNFRKQLSIEINETAPQRSILGLQKTTTYAESFHLGKIMGLQFKKMAQKPITDKYFLFSAQKVLEMSLIASVCYFTLATECRFQQLDEDLQNLKIADKYKKLNHNSQIKKCKILHLKAIEIAGKHLSSSNGYFLHLLQSFNKNYKSVLDEIEEVGEVSVSVGDLKTVLVSDEYQFRLMKKGKQVGKKGRKVKDKHERTKSKARKKEYWSLTSSKNLLIR